MDDNESIDKSSLYHEPFNVNMYTSAASGCTLDMQRHHITPDYTGKYNKIFFIIRPSFVIVTQMMALWRTGSVNVWILFKFLFMIFMPLMFYVYVLCCCK